MQVRNVFRGLTAGVLALTAGVAAACGSGNKSSRETIHVVGSGTIGAHSLGHELAMADDWYATGDAARQRMEEGERCSANSINMPLDDEQRERLKKFVEGEDIPRYDPLTKEPSVMRDEMVGWVCMRGGKTSILYSTQGRHFVLGQGSTDPSPYGPDVQEQLDPEGRGRLLQGRVVAGFAMGDHGFFLLGMDGGWFQVGDVRTNPLSANGGATFASAVSAAIVARSGRAAALIINNEGGRPPESDADVPMSRDQNVVVSHDGTDQGKREAEKLHSGLMEVIEEKSRDLREYRFTFHEATEPCGSVPFGMC